MNILRHPAVIIVLILLVVLLFGSKRLPDFARSVGQSLKIFKKEVKELKDDGTNQTADGRTEAPTSGTENPAAPATQDSPSKAPVPGGDEPKA